MLNKRFAKGDKLSLPVAADTASGTPVLIGSMPGILATDEGEGGNPAGYASVWMEGVFRVPVTTTTTLAVGAPVYITGGGALTPVSTSNTLWGYAIEPKGSSAQTIAVKLAKV